MDLRVEEKLHEAGRAQIRQTAADVEVRVAIRRARDVFVQRHPWLKHQSAIGLIILLTSVAGTGSAALLYINGHISAWLCVPLLAFFASIAHEIEHDTIHTLYFKNHPRMRDFIFALTWVLKPNGPNPWVRNTVHLHHHRYSGTPEDIEEQFIGNGSPYGPLRFLIMADPLFSLSLFPTVRRNSKAFRLWQLPAAFLPMHAIFTAIWVAWLAAHTALWVNPDTDLLTAKDMHLLNTLMVLCVAPGILRVFSLQFISSSMHYFGGVKGLLAETQVLNKWYLLPLQLFCFGFGLTHSIHHIVVGQPFYLRHLIRHQCYPAMRQRGVRFNDMGTFRRRNHYLDPSAAAD
jgi:fatty acid desaturase